MSDPILPLQVWPEGILQARIPANDNALSVEATLRPCLGVANDEAGGDADGDVWIVGSAPTGAFASFDEHDVALYTDGNWKAWAPFEGMRLVVNDVRKVFDGSIWDDDPSISGGAGAWGSITGTLASQTDLQAALDAKAAVGIPQNSQSAAYTLVLGDANKHILHPSADTTARIFTIPANSSVAYPIGTAVTFVNQNAGGVITIAITTDTMRLAGAGTTGSRTLAANGVATALKITSTEWIISGTGLT